VPAHIAVSVPARPEFLHILRSVVASVAARLDFPYDAIEDLRIAVDEACAQLLSRAAGASELRVRVTPSPDGLEVVAAADVGPPGWPPPGVEASLAWQVIEALADSVSLVEDGGGPAFRISKTLPGAPTSA
jgi:serine/threonine-protein kinase RsbW